LNAINQIGGSTSQFIKTKASKMGCHMFVIIRLLLRHRP
jgi:hypothetical protein